MSKIKSSIALILVSLTILMCFSGCGKDKTVLEIPMHIYNEYIDSEDDKGLYEKARLFVDNTFGVYGYILDGTGEKSGYCEVLSQLSEFMNKYKSEEYYCLEDIEDKKTQWVQKDEDDLNFRKKAFYEVYNKLSNPYELKDVDMTTGLNIYVTDLAEGAVANKQLAEAINANIISGRNRSALLYCFLVKYQGLNSIDDTYVINDGDVVQIHKDIRVEKKPVYVFVSGSTREIEAFYKEFNKRIAEKGYEEGKNYYFEKFLSGRGLKSAEAVLRTDMFSVSRESLENDPLNKFYRMDNTQLNFDMEETLSNVVFEDLYESLPGLFVKATSAQAANLGGDQKYERRFSFMLDLPKSEAKDAEYTLGIDAIYYANDETVQEVPVSQEGETAAAETTQAEQTAAEGEKGEKAEEPKVEVIKVKKFVEMNKDERFSLIDDKNELRMMTTQSELKTEGFTVKRIDKTKAEGLGKKGDGIAEDVEISAGENGSYLVTITTSADKQLQNKYDVLILCYSVKAVSEADETVPDWINKYNADSAKSYGNSNIYTHAEDLKYIYEYLNGTMANEELKQQYADYMATTVCSFPVLIDFRDADK